VRPTANDVSVSVVLAVILPIADRTDFKDAAFGQRQCAATRTRKLRHRFFVPFRAFAFAGFSSCGGGGVRSKADRSGA
jgi:hypothetical protein